MINRKEGAHRDRKGEVPACCAEIREKRRKAGKNPNHIPNQICPKTLDYNQQNMQNLNHHAKP
jgi:hypothetical protein